MGFRFTRKAAEVNIKLLCNLQGYHHFKSQASTRVIAYHVCLFVSLWLFPITNMPVHHVWDWILSEYRLFTQWHLVRVQKEQRAINLLGFCLLAHGNVMQFGSSLTLYTPDFCRRYILVIKYNAATLIFNRLSVFVVGSLWIHWQVLRVHALPYLQQALACVVGPSSSNVASQIIASCVKVSSLRISKLRLSAV